MNNTHASLILLYNSLCNGLYNTFFCVCEKAVFTHLIFVKWSILQNGILKELFSDSEFCERAIFSMRNLWKSCFFYVEFCERAAKQPVISSWSTPALILTLIAIISWKQWWTWYYKYYDPVKVKIKKFCWWLLATILHFSCGHF